MLVIRIILFVGLIAFAVYEIKQFVDLIKERKKAKLSEEKAKFDKECDDK